jgi:hypothetical protein
MVFSVRGSAFLLALAALSVSPALGGDLRLAGPLFDPATNTGFKFGGILVAPGRGVNSSGVAVGFSGQHFNGNDMGNVGVRWDGTGDVDALGILGNSGRANSWAHAINTGGTSVGFSYKYVDDVYQGSLPVRWEASGTAATELQHLGVDQDGRASGTAWAINDAGTAAGFSQKFVNTIFLGERAVRWDANATAATELGHLGANPAGFAQAWAYDMNAGGTIVGRSTKYDTQNRGVRGVRWNVGSTTAVELQSLNNNTLTSEAFAINLAGVIVGYSAKNTLGEFVGNRAVRWNAGSAVPGELGILGLGPFGETESMAYAVNASGTAVGYVNKWTSGQDNGKRPVKWGGFPNAIELQVLGTNALGFTEGKAYAVNDAGTAVGYLDKYVGGNVVSRSAVAWLPDNSVVELDTLNLANVNGNGTWQLAGVSAIAEDGWIAGNGTFFPTNGASYAGLFVAQLGLGGRWLNTSGVNNAWSKGANWSSGTPAIQLDAIFNQNAAYTVAFSNNAEARNITISAGTVTLALGSYSLTLEGEATINPGARLVANGTIVGDVVNLGIFSPGNSPGTVAILGDYTDGGILELEIGSASLMDLLDVSGDVDLSGVIQVKLDGGYVPSGPGVYDLVDWQGTMSSTASFDFAEAALPSGLAWDTSSFAVDGSIAVVAVPEPASLGLVAAFGLMYLRRRR